MCRFALVVSLTIGGICPPAMRAHEAPINLFVNAATNRLYTVENFAAGRLALAPGGGIATTTPGIGISLPSNGVAVGTEIIVDGLPGLFYWNGGSTLIPTSQTLSWDPPEYDILGNPANSSGRFEFSSSSGMQLGMQWATYIDSFFWEADGWHRLASLDAAPGVYGTVIRLRSSDHLASRPFVVPFVYDPFDDWDLMAEDQAVATMRALAETDLPGDFDLDENLDCRDADALVLNIATGNHEPGYDLDGDGLVNSADLEVWLMFAATQNLLPGQNLSPGDANLDGVVDVSDFNAWNTQKFSTAAGWCGGDFSADGFVDVTDFNIWNAHKFQGGPAAAVPEPTPLLWGPFILCFAAERRHAGRAALKVPRP